MRLISLIPSVWRWRLRTNKIFVMVCCSVSNNGLWSSNKD